jgi:uncharacterized protein YbjT (DUF2867 family)
MVVQKRITQMKVLIIGATGATGKDLLEIVLEDTEIQKVDIFVRREVNMQHEKLHTHIIDFDKPEEWKDLVTGDVLFSCLGTTRKIAGSKEAQWKVDYEYQYQFAKTARENGVEQYVLVSATGASSKSIAFYNKMKGRLEDAVKLLGFPKIIIFNPPLLIRENTDRKVEIIAEKLIKFFNKIGFFHSQTLSTKALAEAMIESVKALKNGTYYAIDAKKTTILSFMYRHKREGVNVNE